MALQKKNHGKDSMNSGKHGIIDMQRWSIIRKQDSVLS